MKQLYFDGLEQAACILEKIQPYMKKTKEEWKTYIKSTFIRYFKESNEKVECVGGAGFTCVITDIVEDDVPIVEVLINPVMMQQYFKNNMKALPYSYADIDYMERVGFE